MDTGTDGIDIYMDSHQRALEFGVHYYHIQVIDDEAFDRLRISYRERGDCHEEESTIRNV